MCYQKHQDCWTSLVASDWASGLICIIRFSQLWNCFDLPPSLVTECPSPLFFSCFIHHTHFFPVLHVHQASLPWYSNLSIPHIVVILCSSTLIYFNCPPDFFSSHFFLHLSYSWWYIEEVLTVLVLNSLFGFHLSNELKNWINFFSSDTKGIWKTHSHTSYTFSCAHTHILSCTGWKRGCCLSGEMSPGKCFPLQKSLGYHRNLWLLSLVLRRGRDLTSQWPTLGIGPPFCYLETH